MLVSVDTCGISVLYHAHSPFLFACDRVSRNWPITRTACDLRLCTFIEDPTASSLSACSYQSIHVACLLYTTSHSPFLIACDRVSRNRPITRTARVLRLCTFIEDSTAPSLSACYLSSHTGGLSGGVLVAPKLSLLHALMP